MSVSSAVSSEVAVPSTRRGKREEDRKQVARRTGRRAAVASMLREDDSSHSECDFEGDEVDEGVAITLPVANTVPVPVPRRVSMMSLKTCELS